mmetsp:Transcript_2490/g.3853  ORF Transcript_2490/g.3853 Transcript_2490/m.3853 type:complete len:111 (+) Transcript_2490:50-382(+)
MELGKWHEAAQHLMRPFVVTTSGPSHCCGLVPEVSNAGHLVTVARATDAPQHGAHTGATKAGHEAEAAAASADSAERAVRSGAAAAGTAQHRAMATSVAADRLQRQSELL